jgi:hypothetical protein
MATTMNRRHTLHELVDRLPDDDLETAIRVLRGLELVPDAFTVLLENAPIDDEPCHPDDLEPPDENEILISHEEVKRRFLGD